MRRIVKKILIIMGMVLITIFGIVKLAPIDENHILSSLKDKHKYLDEATKKRIIIVGGSSALFGFDSSMIEAEFKEYDVINMGLHAGLGLEFMINNIEDKVREGDIVIINSEYSHFYGKYNGEGVLNNLVKNNGSYINNLSFGNLKEMILGFPEFIRGQVASILKNVDENNVGVQNRNNIDENGDIKVFIENERKEVNPSLGSLKGKYDNRAIQRLNKLKENLNRKNVTVYMTLAPILDLQAKEWGNELEIILDKLENEVNIKIINNIYDEVYSKKYMYDTVYHLDEKGREIRTRNIMENLRMESNKRN